MEKNKILAALTAATVIAVIILAAKKDDQTLSLKEALKIAAESECAKDGVIQKDGYYNPNTKTWWINLKPNDPKPHCANPACVMSEKTKTAETNWRCTGLLPQP